MKTTIIHLYILIFAALLFAQKPAGTCDLALSKSPELHGLKLGMTEDAFLKAVPGAANARTGEVFFVRDDALPKTDDFAGVRDIRAVFFEGKLYNLQVVYTADSTKDLTLEQFAGKISARLSSSAWELGSIQGTIQCRDFGMLIHTLPVYLILEDTNAAREKNDPVKKAARNKKRRAEAENYSSVFDIRNFTKVFIPDTLKPFREIIYKTLKEDKSLVPLTGPTGAEFFIEYNEDTEELRVYYVKDNQTVVVWAEDLFESKKSLEDLVRDFLKVLKRNKKLTEPEDKSISLINNEK